MSVTLTPAQIRCLMVGPWHDGFAVADYPLKVASDRDGWIVVEDAADADEEESGVLVSPNGIVHYSGPIAPNLTDDPWPLNVTNVNDNTITLEIGKES